VKTVLDLLSDKGVVDELGIAPIRDSLSAALFPGFSTIQTRAKYFITLPRIFKDYAVLSRSQRGKLREYLGGQEMACRNQLVSRHGSGEKGIIGSTFAGKSRDVARPPSSVYWNGLRVFGLVQTHLPLSQFLSTYADPRRGEVDAISWTQDRKGDDPEVGKADDVYVLCPTFGETNWLEKLSIHLDADEARFLLNRMSSQPRVKASLLGTILMHEELRTAFTEDPEYSFDDFCDLSPVAAALDGEVLQRLLDARDFWRLLEGAHVLYNCMLQHKYGEGGLQEEFEARLARWRTETVPAFDWSRWDTLRLWQRADQEGRQVRDYTRTFIGAWIELVRGGATDRSRMEALVVQQEIDNKGARARLRPGADERISEWIGLDGLEYRLSQARVIVGDIHAGLLQVEGGS